MTCLNGDYAIHLLYIRNWVSFINNCVNYSYLYTQDYLHFLFFYKFTTCTYNTWISLLNVVCRSLTSYVTHLLLFDSVQHRHLNQSQQNPFSSLKHTDKSRMLHESLTGIVFICVNPLNRCINLFQPWPLLYSRLVPLLFP